MNRILLVDDEQNVLNALRRELQEGYEVEAFVSPAEAIRHAGDTEYDLVIADYLMPEMNGVQFLQQFRRLQPDAARLILSAHTDIQGLLNAINETHIYRFIAKPWDRLELGLVIEQAIKYGHLLKENRRLAERYRSSSLADEPAGLEASHAYHIALVDGDENVSRFIQNGLESGGGQGADNDLLWREIVGDHSAAPENIGFQVHAFTSGGDMLSQAPLTQYDLVIAAQTLPDMSGVAFLKNWMHVQPDSARLLIGRPRDMGLLSQAVNEVQVYGFLEFGWDTREMSVHSLRHVIWQVNRLKVSVMEALAARELVLENARLADKIRKVE